jgi:hypothetical protein
MENLNQLNDNNNSKKKSYPSLLDSQIDSIFSQFQYNEMKNNNQSYISYLLEKIESSLFIQIIKTHKGSLHLQKILSKNSKMDEKMSVGRPVLTSPRRERTRPVL